MRVTVTNKPLNITNQSPDVANRSGVRRQFFVRAIGLLVALGTMQVFAVSADADQTIDRIEEDWELVVTTPDSGTTAPQVTCVISPTGDLDCVHATIELNHHTQPNYASGGVHLQVWRGETIQAAKCSSDHRLLQHDGETVRWTQRVSLSDGTLKFEVLNGTSQTWGAFGAQGVLSHLVSSNLSSLSGYNSSVSTANSGVGYAGNRVSKLALTAVRYYSGEELVQEVTSETVVHGQ